MTNCMGYDYLMILQQNKIKISGPSGSTLKSLKSQGRARPSTAPQETEERLEGIW